MKYKTLLIALIMPLAALAQWDDTEITSVSKEVSRTEFMSYDVRDEAVTFKYDNSPFYVPLNGKWDFRRVDDLSVIDRSFYVKPSGADSINVPGYWDETSASDLQGLKAPALPENNAVGQYYRTVNIPTLWRDRDIFIKIDGAKSGVALYVNGKMAGYSDDPQTPAEFNISKFVTDGANHIGLEVYKWTTAGWLGNNSLTGTGIEGGVSLYSQPRIHIQDFIIAAVPDSLGKKGDITADIIVRNGFNVEQDAEVWFEVSDAKGNIMHYNSRPVTIAGMGGVDTVRFERTIPNVKFWSHETPNLYTVVMRTRYKGRFSEYVPYKVGFAGIGAYGEELLVNGKEIKPEVAVVSHYGLAPDEKSMREQVKKLKAEGKNTVALVYHPAKNKFYQICSEYGMYIVDVLGIDTHLSGQDMGENGTLGNNPRWNKAYIDRSENAYYYNRNRTGLVGWDISPCAGAGFNIYRTEKNLRELDPERAKNVSSIKDNYSICVE